MQESVVNMLGKQFNTEINEDNTETYDNISDTEIDTMKELAGGKEENMSCQTSIKNSNLAQGMRANDFSNLTEIHYNEATNNPVPNDVYKFKRYMAGTTSRHRTSKNKIGQKGLPRHMTIKTSDHI